MANFQASKNKRKWKEALNSRPVLAFLFLILLVFAWSVFGFWGKMRETSKNKQIAENKIADLQAQKESLTSEIDKLKTNTGVEESIRDKFGLVKDGEGLIIIVDDKDKPEANQAASTGGFWSFLTGWLK
ncbi:MAG: septum formation initiator family protein [Patescibacteria group bacterium]